jgi:hypothetical protein
MHRGRLPDRLLPPRSRGRPAKTERPRRFTKREQHPINHHGHRPGANPRSRTEISLDARAQTTQQHDVGGKWTDEPTPSDKTSKGPSLTPGRCTDKQVRWPPAR